MTSETNTARVKDPELVECAIISEIGGQPHVALLRSPETGETWALPSEALRPGDSPDSVARRQIAEHPGLSESALDRVQLLRLEGRQGPHGRAHTLVAVLPPDVVSEGGQGAGTVVWHPVADLQSLAFDDGEVIARAMAASRRPWHCYRYARPMVAADCAVFSIRNEALHVALVQRRHATEQDKWALPGGFLRENEPPMAAARRELFEETGIADRSLADQPLEEIGTYGDPGRDPRGWVISTAFLTLIPMDRVDLVAGSDAQKAEWFEMDALPELAFDHARILQDARIRLARLVSTDLTPSAGVVFAFLPGAFTLAQAQQMFEIVSGRKLDRGNFRKWIAKYWDLEDTGDKAPWGRHRPAALFRLIGLKG